MFGLYVFVSQKTGRIARALAYDINGRYVYITFDTKIILQLTDLRPSDLNNLQVGFYPIVDGKIS